MSVSAILFALGYLFIGQFFAIMELEDKITGLTTGVSDVFRAMLWLIFWPLGLLGWILAWLFNLRKD